MRSPNARLRNASIAIILFHAHGDRRLHPALARRRQGLCVGPSGEPLRDLLHPWRCRIGGFRADYRLVYSALADRPRKGAREMLMLRSPLLIAYRPAQLPAIAREWRHRCLFYGRLWPLLLDHRKERRPNSKATATGINMLLINILMIGGHC